MKENKSHDEPSSNVSLDHSDGLISTGGMFRETNHLFVALLILLTN